MGPARPPVPGLFLLLVQFLDSVFLVVGLGISGGMRGEGLQAICSVRGAQPCGQRLWLRDLRTHFICFFTVSPMCQGLCPVGERSNYRALDSVGYEGSISEKVPEQRVGAFAI